MLGFTSLSTNLHRRAMSTVTTPTSYQLIYATVRQIPKGRVATYGQIAELSGLPRQARQVGYALHALPEKTTVPWHRVVNAQGKISLRDDSDGAGSTQRKRLEREGVRFSGSGVIDMATYRWLS
jgi:methylated-DNA-protein-cysteine methyltransferase related protein